MAWMDMKDNTIDFIIGPIENYEDQLYGYKTAHEAYILIKDKEWSARLENMPHCYPDCKKLFRLHKNIKMKPRASIPT